MCLAFEPKSGKKVWLFNRGSNNEKKYLYQQIIQLLFSEYIEEFEETYKEVIESQYLLQSVTN